MNEVVSKEFRDMRRTFEHLEAEGLFIIRTALQRIDIKLHSITSRIKELRSFLDKTERIQTKKPFEDIHDIVGLRVTCLFLSDIDRIGTVIRESFLVISEDNKIEGSEVSSFGYMSVHFIVMMKKEYVGPRYDHISNMPFEIQVRTIAMDAWANVSHYLDYKSETDVPTDLRRDFYALSGLFYVADKHFEMFFRSRTATRQQLAKAFAETDSPVDQEINLDSLAAYLSNKFPDRKHAEPKHLSELISELSAAGFNYINELDGNIERGAEAFALYEKEKPPANQSKRFADMGVVRCTLDITSEKSRAMRGNKDLERYQSLLK
jgi:ppGpp synthetase/RelA/SpoT-type nucleotidyltranferase